MALDLNPSNSNVAPGSWTYRIGRTALESAGGPPLAQQELARWAELLSQGFPLASLDEIGAFHYSGAQIYDVYARFVQRNGNKAAQDELAAGKQVIVGLRSNQRSTRVNKGVGTYEDHVAIIWQNLPKAPATLTLLQTNPVLAPVQYAPSITAAAAAATPVKHGLHFWANTIPSAQYEDRPMKIIQDVNPKTGKTLTRKEPASIIDPNGHEIKLRKVEGEDMNGDGRKELAELIPGTYTFKFGTSEHLGPVLRGDNQQRIMRDVNHDGQFTLADVWRNEKGETLVDSGKNFSILIHPGHRGNTDSGGCQTIPVPDFQRFYSALKPGQAHFLYVLVNL